MRSHTNRISVASLYRVSLWIAAGLIVYFDALLICGIVKPQFYLAYFRDYAIGKPGVGVPGSLTCVITAHMVGAPCVAYLLILFTGWSSIDRARRGLRLWLANFGALVLLPFVAVLTFALHTGFLIAWITLAFSWLALTVLALRLLPRRLTKRDASLKCLGCGYDLRQTRAEVCSECGRRLSRRQRLTLGL